MAGPTRIGTRGAVVVTTVVVLLVASSITAGADRVRRVSGWDRRIAPIAHEVERLRHLKFLHPIPARFLSDRAFHRLVTSEGDRPSERARRRNHTAEAELRALGLVDGAFDLAKTVDDVNGADILAFYDPDEKRIVVRGSSFDAEHRVTLAHELTHGLQDQHYDLTRLQEHARSANADDALTALVEGDATRVEGDYYNTLSRKDQRAVDEAEGADPSSSDGGRARQPRRRRLRQLVRGCAARVALRDRPGDGRGHPRARPPRRTGARVPAAAVDPGADGAARTGAGPRATGATRGAPARARDARPRRTVPTTSARWTSTSCSRAGSRRRSRCGRPTPGATVASSCTQRSDHTICADLAFTGRDRAASRRLGDALRLWSAAMPAGAVTVGHGGLRIHSCDPGRAATAPPNSAEDALGFAADRAFVEASMVAGQDPAGHRRVHDRPGGDPARLRAVRGGGHERRGADEAGVAIVRADAHGAGRRLLRVSTGRAVGTARCGLRPRSTSPPGAGR